MAKPSKDSSVRHHCFQPFSRQFLVIGGIAVSAYISFGDATRLYAGEFATSTYMQELSKSITAEAYSRSPEGAQSSGGSYSSLAGAITTAGQTGKIQSILPGNLPPLQLALADGTINSTIGSSGSKLQYQGDRSQGSIDLGFGYLKPQNSDASVGGQAKLATMIGRQFALGSDFTMYANYRDLVVNTVWQIPDSGIRFKLSGGYLWGNQNFNFPSGAATIDLEQYSYLFSTQYVIPRSEELRCLQSIGLSLWGAQAHQLSGNGDPRSYLQETSSDYLIMNDPLKLSEGRLLGASADTQVALRSNMVLKGSAGYEQLRFPFSDGSRELNESAYYNLNLKYEPFRSVSIGTGYKSGAGEERFDIMCGIGNLQLDLFRSKGMNGVADNRGAMLSWHLAIPTRKQQTVPLARRMQPARSDDARTLLAESVARPAQLPRTFLAKVDQTAVSLAATVSKAALPQGATVNSSGDVFITVGTGAPTVNSITRNGAPYSSSTLVTATATQVVIHTRLFPVAASSGDTYVINVSDGSGTYYDVTVSTQ